MQTFHGPGEPAYEAQTIALIGKTLLGRDRPFGAYLNLGWLARLNPQQGERPNRYMLIATLGQTVTHNTAVVGTYVREQQERGERDYSLAQAGARYRLPGGGPVLGVAAGTGLNRDSPRFRIAFAVQWLFGD